MKNVVSIHPYFKAHPGKIEPAKSLLPAFMEKTARETKNFYYDFTVNGDVIHCREGYAGAEGLLEHISNVTSVLQDMLKVADVIRVEVHGPAVELDKLRPSFKALKPEWFVLECGLP
jgi:hypothetical protein